MTWMAAVGCTIFLTGCENDAPEMNINITYNHISDFSGLVDAVNNQTAVLKVAFDENGNLIMTALDRNGQAIANTLTDGFAAVTATFSEKMDALILSVDNNTLAVVNMTNTLSERLEALRKTAESVGASLVYAMNKNGELIVLAIKENGEVIAAELINQTEQLKLLNSNLITVSNKIVTAIDKNTLAVVTMDANMKAAVQSLTAEVESQGGNIQTAINEQGQLVVAAFDRNGSLIKTEIAGVATQVKAAVGAIVTLDGDLTALVTASTAAITKFDADNKQALADVEDAIENIGATIVVAVDGSLTDVKDAINAQKGALVAALNTNGDVIKGAIGDVKDELHAYNASFDEKMGQLKVAINGNTVAIYNLDDHNATAISNLQAKIAGDTEGTLVAAIVDQNTAIVSALTGSGGVAASIVAELGEVKSSLDNIASAVTSINGTLNTKLDAMLTALQTIATNSVNLSYLAKLDDLDDIKTYLSSLSEMKTALDGIKTNTEKLAVLDAISTAVQGINTNTTNLPTLLANIKNAIEALKYNSGVYTIGTDYYLSEAVYDAIKDNPTLSEQLATDLFGSEEPSATITTNDSQDNVSGHTSYTTSFTKIKGVVSASIVDTYGLIKVKLGWAFVTASVPQITCGNHHYDSAVLTSGSTYDTSTATITDGTAKIELTVKTWDETSHTQITTVTMNVKVVHN